MKTKKVPFDIFIPATENRKAVKVATLQIEVVVDDHGQEMVTPESSELIDKTQARYMGLIAGDDIVALRKRHGLTQSALADLIGCGKKSLSRWENERDFPSQIVNTVLRLLEDQRIDLHDLYMTRQARTDDSNNVVQFIDKRQEAPQTYRMPSKLKDGARHLTEKLPA